MTQWTDESRKQVIDDYLAANPTPENTVSIVERIAAERGYTVNGVRMILQKADKYVKKEAQKAKPNGSNGKEKSTRINKTEVIATLSELIEAEGIDVDNDIIGKLTGKAAQYFINIIQQLTEEAD